MEKIRCEAAKSRNRQMRGKTAPSDRRLFRAAGKRQVDGVLWYAAVLMLCAGLVAALGGLVITKNTLWQEQAALARLAVFAAGEDWAGETAGDEKQRTHENRGDQISQTTETARVQRYAQLAEKNPDMTGWIRIEGTEIDYPVMHTPDRPAYYLHRNFEKEEAYSGLPFLDEACTADGRVHIIYAHNMKNGSMFAALHKYQDTVFLEAHGTICFDTLKTAGIYEPVCAFETDTKQLKALAEALLNGKKIPDTLPAQIYKMQNAHDIQNTRILLLITCTGNSPHRRIVMVARESPKSTS